MIIHVELHQDVLADALGYCAANSIAFNDFLATAVTQAIGQTVVNKPILNLNLSLQDALTNASALKSGEEFHIDEVFPNNDWTQMSPGERKAIGKTFKNAVEGAGIASHIGRSSNNKAIYKRL